jgi:hypothetical protein
VADHDIKALLHWKHATYVSIEKTNASFPIRHPLGWPPGVAERSCGGGAGLGFLAFLPSLAWGSIARLGDAHRLRPDNTRHPSTPPLLRTAVRGRYAWRGSPSAPAAAHADASELPRPLRRRPRQDAPAGRPAPGAPLSGAVGCFRISRHQQVVLRPAASLA